MYKRHWSDVKRYEIIEEGDISCTSNHLPITCSITLPSNPHIDLQQFLKLPSWHKSTPDIIKQFQENLESLLTELTSNIDINCNIGVDELCFRIEDILIDTANRVIPKSTFNCHTKPYWNTDVKQAHKVERDMRNIWVSEGRPRGMIHESYYNYKRAKRDFRNIQSAAYEKYINETLDDINHAAECDIRLFWKMINRQKPKRRQCVPEIIISDVTYKSPESVT